MSIARFGVAWLVGGLSIAAPACAQSLVLTAPGGGYAFTPGDPELEPAAFTIEAWIHPTGPSIGGGAGTIVSNAVPGGCYAYALAWALWRYDDGSVALLVGHSPGNGITASSWPVVPVGTTAHVVGVFDGASVRVYVNGVIAGEAGWPAGWSISYAGYPVRVGAAEHCGEFHYRFVGSIDEVRIWNRALTPEEFAFAPCAAPAADPNLVAFWTFDDTYADSSGHGHTLTPVENADFGTALATPVYAPGIATQPTDTRVCPNGTASFSVEGVGTGSLSYQWRHDGVDIDVKANPSADDPQLVIANADDGDAGTYDCVLTSECGDAASDGASLTVCIADFNCDGTVNSTDVSDFINQWFTDQVEGTPVTDWDANGVVNSTDVSAFINSWFEDTAGACG